MWLGFTPTGRWRAARRGRIRAYGGPRLSPCPRAGRSRCPAVCPAPSGRLRAGASGPRGIGGSRRRSSSWPSRSYARTHRRNWRGDAEVQADLGDSAADGTAEGRRAGIGVPLGLGAAFQAQRRDLVRVGGFGDRRRLDVSALGGASEQIALQRHGAEDAALDVGKNTAEVVGAPAYGQRGEAGVVDEFGEGFIQVLAKAQEGSDDMQERGDSVGHGLAGAVLTAGSRVV